MKWTVTFTQPSQGLSYERKIVWRFPFNVIDSSLIGAPEEWRRTSNHIVTVSATVELILAWEFGSVLNPDDSEPAQNDRLNLMKVLFEYARRYAKQKLVVFEPFALEESLALDTLNAEVPCPYHYSRIQVPTATAYVICEVETNPPVNPSSSGGVNIQVNGDLNVSGDVTGRDKIAAGVTSQAEIARSINAESVVIYSYKNPPYNAAELHYFGEEPLRDLQVTLIYTDPGGELKRKQVEEFFPQQDTTMIWHHFKAHVLKENDLIRFRLLRRKSVIGNTLLVEIKGVGTKSNISFIRTQEFELEL